MFSKVLKIGNQKVIVLQEDALQLLGVQEGDSVFVALDRARGQILLSAAETPPAGAEVDDAFARQVSEFFESYQTALEALAKADQRTS